MFLVMALFLLSTSFEGEVQCDQMARLRFSIFCRLQQ